MKYTVHFANDGGATTIATFDAVAMTVSSPDGRSGTYTRDEPARMLHLKGDQDVSITFAENIERKVGFSTRYSTNDGRSGLATIMAVE